MPVYEYQCQSCLLRFEAKQRITEPPLTACIRCGQAVTKLISSPAIMFKGSGWYVTDYSDKLKPTDKGEGQKDGSEKPKEGGSETGKASGSEATSTRAAASASGSGPSAPPAASSAPSSSSTTPAKSTSS
jgi:putative FmdB family regulatory protein